MELITNLRMEHDGQVEELIQALHQLHVPQQQYSLIQYKDHLKIQLETAKDAGQVRGRDLHEIETLNEVLDSVTLEQAQQAALKRLKTVYVGVTRGWSAAQAYDRAGLDKQLGLPPPATTQPTRGRRRPRHGKTPAK